MLEFADNRPTTPAHLHSQTPTREIILSSAEPVEIGRANRHDVRILWSDGKEAVYPSRELRLACPCASCVDEMTGQIRLIAESVPRDVHPMALEPVGRYAISVRWSDGHATGIYTFEMLRAWKRE